MVSGLLDAVLTLGAWAVCSLVLVGTTYRGLDRLDVPNHYVRSLVTTVVATVGGYLLLGALL